MADIFGNSTLPGWQMFTPQSYALAAAPANAEIGKSFAQSFNAAAGRKQEGDQFAAKMALDRDKLIEGARQWNTLHPDPMKPWNTAPTAASGGPTSWMSSPGVSSWVPFNDSGGSGWLGFEEGGRPPVGQPSIVGEGGPEVFVPDKPGTIVPNNQIGMAYDRNGTGAITPTGITSTSSVGDGVAQRTGAGWNGEQKPGWLNAPPAPNWRATNALDAIGKVMQAKTFDDLSKVTAANPEGVMYPQFQNALAEKSQILQRGEAITLRQKEIENNSVEAKSRLDLIKRFNDSFLQLPDAFHVAVRSLGDAAKNPDGTPSPAAIHILQTGQSFLEAQIADKAKAAKLVPTKIVDPKGVTYSEQKVDAMGEIPEPVTKTIGGKNYTVLRTGPNNFQWKAETGEEKPFTDESARQIAKGYDYKSPTRAFWMEQAGGLAMKRMTPEQQASTLDGMQKQVNTISAIAEKRRTPAQRVLLSDLQGQMKAFLPSTATAVETAAPAGAGAAKLPNITTREGFDGLAKGAHYFGKDGKEYVKP